MDPVWFEIIGGLMLGIGLSAACGFRVFVPPLVLSIAGLYFHVPLPESMSFLATETGFFIFLTATLIEVGAYYVPWLDNALDTVATPAAVVAGTLIAAPFLGDLDPWLQWSLALVAGGGAAGAVQSLTNVFRLVSTSTTGGLANPVVSTIENALAAIMSVVTIVFPLITFLILIAIIALVVKFGSQIRWFKKDPEET